MDQAPRLPCWLEVDLDAISANVRALQRWVGAGTALAAVVKAQGYGTGASEVAREAVRAGADWVAVARVHEGIALREAGIRVPILVMNRTEPDEAEAAVTHDLTITVDTGELARALGSVASSRHTTAAVHLKIDTGLHRFGVAPDQALPLAREVAEVDGLDVQALYTHFASADEPDRSFTLEQLARFERTTGTLENAGYRFPMRHAANSAGTLAFPEAHFDLVRVGLTLYGTSPAGHMPPGLGLSPALALRARVARITELAAGDGVGYGQVWHADRPCRIALLTAGYADGVRRGMSNRGEVLINGGLAPIVGRVSMDQTTIDITGVDGVSVGDVATFFGSDGDAQRDLARFAAASDTIPHEALTSIGGRVARVYRRGGRVCKITRLAGEIETPLYTPASLG